jgi:hypothetical protein
MRDGTTTIEAEIVKLRLGLGCTLLRTSELIIRQMETVGAHMIQREQKTFFSLHADHINSLVLGPVF